MNAAALALGEGVEAAVSLRVDFCDQQLVEGVIVGLLRLQGFEPCLCHQPRVRLWISWCVEMCVHIWMCLCPSSGPSHLVISRLHLTLPMHISGVVLWLWIDLHLFVSSIGFPVADSWLEPGITK